jgi:hypothetical protein
VPQGSPESIVLGFALHRIEQPACRAEFDHGATGFAGHFRAAAGESAGLERRSAQRGGNCPKLAQLAGPKPRPSPKPFSAQADDVLFSLAGDAPDSKDLSR